jgi:hypothetical protein
LPCKNSFNKLTFFVRIRLIGEYGLERVAGIEPASSAWKAEVLPLNYTRTSVPSYLVVGEGFEPSKAKPSDLQSDPFDHSGTPPNFSFAPCYPAVNSIFEHKSTIELRYVQLYGA